MHPAKHEIDLLFGEFLNSPGADYQQPLSSGLNQVYNRPLSQSTRRMCYDQVTYEDTLQEGAEYFSLRVTVEPRTLCNVVIHTARATTLVEIVDDDRGLGIIIVIMFYNTAFS